MNNEAPLSEGEKQWYRQFTRKLDQLKGRGTYVTTFFDPRQLDLAEAALRKKEELSYSVYGGYPEAERNVLSIFPSQHRESLPPVKAVVVSWAGGEVSPGHRDLLGAVLSLGLKREQVGDIVTLEGSSAAVMVLEEKTDYICANLVQVGSQAVQCSVVDPAHLALSLKEGKEIKGTVASLRTDSIISLGFGISRSRVVLLIKGGLVRVNWRAVDSPSLQLNEGDQVSLKGRGRLQIGRASCRERV